MRTARASECRSTKSRGTSPRTGPAIAAAVATARRARIATLMLPGVGVKDDIAAARDLGAAIVRIATHCTEADIAAQHFAVARDLGMETVGFLMMAHSVTPERLAREA